jgi:hypothetical protein
MTLLVLSCSRCKEEDCTDSTNPDCPNYVAPVDPCAGKTEVSADFIIEQRVNSIGMDEQFIACDTSIALYNRTHVTASIENAELYKWIIGTDTISGPTASFFFSESQSGQSYPVTLIVQKAPNLTCFPYDNGMDTVTKFIHVINICDNPIYGTFRVAFDSSPSDSFNVAIKTWPLAGDIINECNNLFIINFNKQLEPDSCLSDYRAIGYRYLKFSSGSTSCSSSSGEAYIGSDNNTIQAHYQYWEQSLGIPLTPRSNWPYRTFRGRRIS